MKVIPAIDLMNGAVVRLIKGDPSKKIVYSHSPINVALKWENEGADAIYVVDLDKVLGFGDNKNIICKILKTVSIPVYVGGGLRSINAIKEYICKGVEKVVLSTILFTGSENIRYLAYECGLDNIIAAIDHAEGYIAYNGWRRLLKVNIYDAIQHLIAHGIKSFLVTSINRDGSLSGLDVNTLSKLRSVCRYELMAAGGIRCIDDILTLAQLKYDAAIIGRALYEGYLSVSKIVNLLRGHYANR